MATLTTNTASSSAAPSPAGTARRLTTTHALGFALVVLGIACWPTLVSMVHVWNTSDTYAHGWLIAPISIYLLYQMRAQLARIETTPAWWALPGLVVAGAVWLLATLADVQVVQQLMFVTLAIGLALLVNGRAWCTAAMFPLGFLYLAVPLGDGLTPHLIDMTADFVVHALRLTGIPVYREGTFFVIPSGNWSVVSGCSGMRYLMATVTVGVLFAYLNYRSMWRRAAFVGIAIAVSIVANWLRAYGIVMIAHLSGMKLALGVDHYIYGWVFFGLVIFLLMSIGMIWSEPPGADTRADDAAPGRRGDQALGAGHAAALGAGLAVLLMWPVAAHVASVPVQHPAPVLPVDGELPDGWRESPLPVSDWRPHFVGTPTLLHRAFEQDGRTVGLFVAWYGTQSQGDELVHAANELVREKYEPWRLLRVAPRDTGVESWRTVTESVLLQRSGARQIVVWQSNWTFGRYTTGRLATKLLEVASRLRGLGNPAASVLVYSVPRDESDVDATRAALSMFARGVVPPVTAALARAAGMER